MIRKLFVLVIFSAFLLGLLGSQSVPAGTKENQLKAAILYHIARFVKWPDSAFKDESSPLVICVLGDVAFETELESLQGNLLGQRPIRIQQLSSTDELTQGHILFITKSEGHRLDNIFDALQHRPVLTVSDMDDFAEHGGMINLVKVENNIRFAINLDAAQSADLKLSAKLHDLATKIIRTTSAKGQ